MHDMFAWVHDSIQFESSIAFRRIACLILCFLQISIVLVVVLNIVALVCIL